MLLASVNLGDMSTSPQFPALAPEALAHLSQSLDGYTASSHPAHRGLAARHTINALTALQARVWEQAAETLGTQHPQAAVTLKASNPYQQPTGDALASLVREVLAQVPVPLSIDNQQDTDKPTAVEGCPICGDPVDENRTSSYCSLFCQHQAL